MVSGLNMKFTPQQELSILSDFDVNIENGHINPVFEDVYFSSKENASEKRLSELIEESAYWTKNLLKQSAYYLTLIFVSLLIIVCFLFFIDISNDIDKDISISVKIVLFIISFIITSGFVGYIISFYHSSKEMGSILDRIDGVSLRNYNRDDVLNLLFEYNSIVDKSPRLIPFIYGFYSKELSKKWNVYLVSKGK